MLKLLALLFFTITLGMAQGANAGPFEDGHAAYTRGDYATALRLWSPLAAQGYAEAQHNLGVMYENGTGVPQDYARAYMWFNLSAASSSGEDGKLAINNRNKAAAKMTSAQIEQAQEMARKCQASNFKNCD